MPHKNRYKLRVETYLEVEAENLFAAHDELYRGLLEIYNYFGTHEFIINLQEIRSEEGHLIYSTKFDFQDSSYEDHKECLLLNDRQISDSTTSLFIR